MPRPNISCVEPAGRVAEVPLPVHRVAPPSAGVVAVQRASSSDATVALHRHLDAEPLEDRRHHVDVLGEAVVDDACRASRRRRGAGRARCSGTW